MHVPIEQIKGAMRNTWMAGDYGVVARIVLGSAEEMAAQLPLAPGARVLDVACGTGNLALPLAKRGAAVTGVDIAPNLLEQARARAGEEGLEIRFDEGDAEDLPYPAGSFDAAVSMFGAMFAPRPGLVVSEFARVVRPGGLLALGNWTPESFTGQMFRVTAKYIGISPGLEPPLRWGDEAAVQERLQAQFEDIESRRVPMMFDLPIGPAAAVAFFREHYGPTKMAFARLDEAAQSGLAAELEALWANANTSEARADHCLVPNEYLLTTARRMQAT